MHLQKKVNQMQNNNFNLDDLRIVYEYAQKRAIDYLTSEIKIAQPTGKTVFELSYSDLQNYIISSANFKTAKNYCALKNSPWLIIVALEDYLNTSKCDNRPLYSTKNADDSSIYPASDIRDLIYEFNTETNDQINNNELQAVNKEANDLLKKQTEFRSILAVMHILTYYSKYSLKQNDEYIAEILAFLANQKLSKTIYVYLF